MATENNSHLMHLTTSVWRKCPTFEGQGLSLKHWMPALKMAS